MNKTSLLLIFFIIIHLLSAINPIYSQDNEENKKYGFSIGTSFGILYGQAFEYVYPIPGDTKGELLSELIWDVKPVFYFGFNADFGLNDLSSGPGLFSSLSLKRGFVGISGKMEDRDWMSIENSKLTHFSSHTNETDEFVRIDLAVGASFPVKFLYIKPFVSSSWTRYSFMGRDGYYQHAKENPAYSGKYDPIEIAPNKPASGRVISYQQDWLILAIGCSIGTNILAPFSFDLSFQISPLTYCAATDNHYLQGNVYAIYKDFTSFGVFLEPKSCISIAVKDFEFSLEIAYKYISRTVGESYYNKNSSFALGPNKAGASLSVWDFQLLAKYNL